MQGEVPPLNLGPSARKEFRVLEKAQTVYNEWSAKVNEVLSLKDSRDKNPEDSKLNADYTKAFTELTELTAKKQEAVEEAERVAEALSNQTWSTKIEGQGRLQTRRRKHRNGPARVQRHRASRVSARKRQTHRA